MWPAESVKRLLEKSRWILIVGLVLVGLAMIGRGVLLSNSPFVERPNILLVTLCSTRADRVGDRYERDLTPNLDRLAGQGLQFTRAYANATTTLPSHASLLTGLLPDRHGVIDFETRLNLDLPSLPSVLRLYGYRSAWGMESDNFGAAPTSAGMVPPAGLGSAQGFLDAFDAQFYLSQTGLGLDAFRAWLSGDDRPFFALVLLRSAHLPYGSGEPFVSPLDERVEAWLSPPAVQRPGASLRAEMAPAGDREAQRMRQFLKVLSADEQVKSSLDAAYDSGIANVDRFLGHLIAALESTGKKDNTIVVVVGDHGESLGEGRRLGHDNNLLDAVVQVPLVWSDPEFTDQGSQRDMDVSVIDIMPTLLSRVDATVPVGLDGRDISKGFDKDGTMAPRPVRTQAAALPGMVQRRSVSADTRLDEVVNSGNLRVMFSSGDGPKAQRRNNGSLVEVELESSAVQALIQWKQSADSDRRTGRAERVKLSDEAVRQLQAEGYW